MRKADRKDEKRARTRTRTRDHIPNQVESRPTPGATPPVQAPPWSTLPYLVLCRVFEYAAAELDSVEAVRQYVAGSLVCRAFVEPALRALYERPPLLTMNMAHMLVGLLEASPATTMFDYRQMIRALHIEVGSLAGRVYRGRHLDVAWLVARCPRLTSLDLYHYKDQPPYRQQTENLRWTYPAELFEALGEEGQAIRLRSWRWNRRLMAREWTLEQIQELHLTPAFADLRRVAFVNYQRPSLEARRPEEATAADARQAEAFAALLAALPQLTCLVMESSTAANELLLPLLPKTLEALEFVNCWDVSAACFTEYLLTHGQRLRRLTLHHNQALSLSFLPVLADACPALERLQMNLTYYNHNAFYNDATPLYDSLLLPSEVPAWPASIQAIELEHLRKWEPAAADVFFQSLVDCAPRMPLLRVLAIKAMLDIPWRQRCDMRDRWEATLARVFLRPPSQPEPAASLLYYRDKAAATETPRHARPTRPQTTQTTPQRRSFRLAIQASESSSRASSTARDLRPVQRGAISYREPDSDEDMEDEEEEDDQDEKVNNDKPKNELPIHGLCHVVDIRIDNQKPREIQYHMDDFLDGEDSHSDNEWTGDEVEVQEYAW